jgi:CBS domain-containing protein
LPVADAYAETLSQLEAALQVRHIARRPLITVTAEATPAEAAQLAAEHAINNLPVVGADGDVVGVLENVGGEIADGPRPRADVGTVRDSMRPLNDGVLVESQRSIEGLLEDLLEAPYYQLVVSEGRIDGIVTASDLNKAPVRVLAYATVARLETAMTAAIRHATKGDDEAAVRTLGGSGAGQVRADHERLKEGNLNAALLAATTFKQKGIILARLGVFGGGDTVEQEFDDLYQRLRNPLMHMTPFVAESIAGLREFATDLATARRRTDEALRTAAA